MANQLQTWLPVIFSAVIAVPPTIKILGEIKNLHLRHAKEFLDLINQLGNRMKNESANAFRKPDTF
jgi:hypothetical protein